MFKFNPQIIFTKIRCTWFKPMFLPEYMLTCSTFTWEYRVKLQQTWSEQPRLFQIFEELHGPRWAQALYRRNSLHLGALPGHWENPSMFFFSNNRFKMLSLFSCFNNRLNRCVSNQQNRHFHHSYTIMVGENWWSPDRTGPPDQSAGPFQRWEDRCRAKLEMDSDLAGDFMWFLWDYRRSRIGVCLVMSTPDNCGGSPK